MDFPILFSTTMRDGTQGEGCTVTNLDAALAAIRAEDRHGVEYHELGFCVGNDMVRERVCEAKRLGLNGKIAVFGRTHETDVDAIIGMEVPVGVLVGKSRKADAEKVIRRGADKNLELIEVSVRKLVDAGLEVVYDAEHFFDAVHSPDSDFALLTIKAALKGGATWIVLCDTNGGMSVAKLLLGISMAQSVVSLEKLGIHCHNDRGLAVSLSEAALEAGVRHVQGVFGGFGERVGNANLITILGNLSEDHGVTAPHLDRLTETYHAVCAALNQTPDPRHPYVGRSAAYTEAGMHQSGQQRDGRNYLHMNPAKYGNRVRVGVTEQSGRANVKSKCDGLGIEVNDTLLTLLTACITDKVAMGYDFSHEATFELLARRTFGTFEDPVSSVEYEVRTSIRDDDRPPRTMADLRCVINGATKLHNADGDGPVNALDNVFRRTVKREFPNLLEVRLVDFNVSVFDVSKGTAAKVRVYCVWRDRSDKTWSTMAAHDNMVHASWLAVFDGYMYKLLRNGHH